MKPTLTRRRPREKLTCKCITHTNLLHGSNFPSDKEQKQATKNRNGTSNGDKTFLPDPLGSTHLLQTFPKKLHCPLT